jgi:hypothetical protein
VRSRPRPLLRRSELAGIVIAFVYLATGAISLRLGLVPGRPIYDGFGPPAPYRWVKPPQNAQTQEAPSGAEGEVPLTDTASQGGDVVTPDFQTQLLIPEAAVVPVKGETAAKVQITPQDPATKPAPPKGFSFDSNAYVLEGTYTKSGEAVKLAKPVSLIMRYATSAADLYLLDGETWQPMKANRAGQSLQMFADITSLGIYVALTEVQPSPSPSPKATRGFLASGRLLYGGLGAIFLVIFLLLLWFRFRRSRSKRSSATRSSGRRKRRRRR